MAVLKLHSHLPHPATRTPLPLLSTSISMHLGLLCTNEQKLTSSKGHGGRQTSTQAGSRRQAADGRLANELSYYSCWLLALAAGWHLQLLTGPCCSLLMQAAVSSVTPFASSVKHAAAAADPDVRVLSALS